MAERKFTPPTSFPAECVTVGGDRVRILSDQGCGIRPLIGEVLDKSGRWSLSQWSLEGRFYGGGEYYSGLDLCKPEPTVKHSHWINVYADGFSTLRDSRGHADRGATANPPRTSVLRLDLMSDDTVRTEMEDV